MRKGIQKERDKMGIGGFRPQGFDQFLVIVSYTDPSEFLMTAVSGICPGRAWVAQELQGS